MPETYHYANNNCQVFAMKFLNGVLKGGRSKRFKMPNGTHALQAAPKMELKVNKNILKRVDNDAIEDTTPSESELEPVVAPIALVEERLSLLSLSRSWS